jgi:phosphopantothenoylcysteine decarboxylase
VANILLGVTGSVAAIRTPEVFFSLKKLGHQVRVVATQGAIYFFDPVALDSSHVVRNPEIITVDEDEWPGRAEGAKYQRGDQVVHIELRRWADLFLVAPLDANTLAKFACGLCDNCLTCVWRAWEPTKPVILAPAMNTYMWQHPTTLRQIRLLAADAGAGHVPGHFSDVDTIRQINARAPKFRIAMPVSKELACGDVGIGAMAELPELLKLVDELTQNPTDPPTDPFA